MRPFAAFSLLLAALPAAAQQAPPAPPAQHADWLAKMLPLIPRGYVCQFAASPPVIDGKLDDAAWQDAPWTDEFKDIEGDAKPKPRFRTRARMLWDENNFYIAADLDEPHVWATLTNHDAVIFQDPDFEVFIDPNGDSHEYFEFEMNALNTTWDLFLPKPYKDGGPAMNAWEIPGLKSGVHVRGSLNNPADTDEGWSVEIAFPWKALGECARRPTPPAEGDQWRVGFSRVEWQIEIKDGKYVKVPNTPENNWIWSPQGIIDMHRPERWGYVQFTRKPPGTTTFSPDPSAPARNRLQEIYYAQKDHFARHNRWAASLKDLSISPDPTDTLGTPLIHLTPEGFIATVALTLPDKSSRLWSIRQDALVQPLSNP